MQNLAERYIIIDSGIPFIKGVFENYCNVIYAPAHEFKSEIWWIKRHVRNARIALIVRTRTKCNRELLQGSGVDFIATATIGTDHIDTSFCDSENIVIKSAAGCNSGGVMQWVFTALALARQKITMGESPYNLHAKSIELLHKIYSGSNDITIGVVGCGNVGSKVVNFAKGLGWNVLVNDPPKRNMISGHCELEDLLRMSDIVTIHVPLNDSTYKLAGQEFFEKIKEGALFVNSSRGEVVDDAQLIENDRVGGFLLDVWNNEPVINRELMNTSLVATPHIAGYSKEGKEMGTQMAIRATARFLGISNLFDFTVNLSPTYHVLDIKGNITEQLLSFFDIESIDKNLRNSPDDFEKLRNNYTLRSEFILKH